MTTLSALRVSLLPAAAGTLLMTYSTVRSLLAQSKARYLVVNAAGKKVLSHPYRPWAAVPEECAAAAAAAYAACRAYENSKEWLQLGLPLMWTLAAFGGALPYATPGAAGAVTLATSAAWAVGNEMYTKGYRAENPDGRSAGFRVRTAVFRVWMYGSALSIACFAVRHFGVYELP